MRYLLSSATVLHFFGVSYAGVEGLEWKQRKCPELLGLVRSGKGSAGSIRPLATRWARGTMHFRASWRAGWDRGQEATVGVATRPSIVGMLTNHLSQPLHSDGGAESGTGGS